MGSATAGDPDAVAYKLQFVQCKEHRLILVECHCFFRSISKVIENVTSFHREVKSDENAQCTSPRALND